VGRKVFDQARSVALGENWREKPPLTFPECGNNFAIKLSESKKLINNNMDLEKST
jgi:hypothetical protein